MLNKLLPVLMALTLSACGTTSSGLKYSANAEQPVKLSQSTEPVVVGAFQDQRDGDKNWLGVIRGGFGNHLKTLTADRPVTEIVHNAFEDGLRARKVAVTPGTGNRITGKITTLYADQIIRREGNAKIELTVSDSRGVQRFSRTYTATRIEGSALTLSTGVLASVDDLRDVLQRTLSELVDKALDDPELRAALQI
ncbi:MAG: YajG family lipoprotein [Bacteroidota bacterium]